MTFKLEGKDGTTYYAETLEELPTGEDFVEDEVTWIGSIDHRTKGFAKDVDITEASFSGDVFSEEAMEDIREEWRRCGLIRDDEVLGYEDVEFLDTEESENQEESCEGYEEEKVSDTGSVPLPFSDEIKEVLTQEPAWIDMIPIKFRAEDGTEFSFFSPGPDEVELEVVTDQRKRQSSMRLFGYDPARLSDAKSRFLSHLRSIRICDRCDVKDPRDAEAEEFCDFCGEAWSGFKEDYEIPEDDFP